MARQILATIDRNRRSWSQDVLKTAERKKERVLQVVDTGPPPSSSLHSMNRDIALPREIRERRRSGRVGVEHRRRQHQPLRELTVREDVPVRIVRRANDARSPQVETGVGATGIVQRRAVRQSRRDASPPPGRVYQLARRDPYRLAQEPVCARSSGFVADSIWDRAPQIREERANPFAVYGRSN